MRVESDDLRASRKRLALAADAERRGLERSLHDGVQQQLVGLAANLELAAGSVDADPAAAKELFAEMARDIRDAMDQTRKLADRIYPPQLEVGGLVVALRSAAADANVPARIEIARDQTYPPEVAGAMYFCCRDLLENVSAGSTVAITARSEGERSRSTSSWTATSTRTAPFSAIASRLSEADARSSRSPVTGRG